jgi:hypothetical protein
MLAGKIIREINAELAALGSRRQLGDIPTTLRAIRDLDADARAFRKGTMPKCADPAGYWARAMDADLSIRSGPRAFPVEPPET